MKKGRYIFAAFAAVGIAAAGIAINTAGSSVDLSKTVEGRSDVLTEDDFREATSLLKEKIDERPAELKIVDCQYSGDEESANDINTRLSRIVLFCEDQQVNDGDLKLLVYNVRERISRDPITFFRVAASTGINFEDYRDEYADRSYNYLFAKQGDDDWEFITVYDPENEEMYEDISQMCFNGESDIYSTEEREEALGYVMCSLQYEENHQLIDVRYAGDESASQERLKALNDRYGTRYDECMTVYADMYSYSKKNVTADNEMTIARKSGGEWEIVEKSLKD